ncbi:very short patch repair endonuclease [Flavobacterium magnum]|uniref:Very short patch repair endonuclease n=1 Tax=Flavobacterium magnum TaxID=2162713 RepID=A0A2S0RDL9_9FLAO|nr:very short patch repair endonuclease [Flavobacterium magnum]AWA29390.1 very short patch repair endonuclease [Flavobacterium magnum]
MDKSSKDKRSKIMRAIKSKDTKSEVLLAKALWKRGHRYRKHNKSIFGTPDLSFKKYKIAIFVDSEFFHGKHWDIVEKRPKANAEFWQKKIERNMQRDDEVNVFLIQSGWTVLRFWSDDIRKNLYTTVRTIEKHIAEIHDRIYFE